MDIYINNMKKNNYSEINDNDQVITILGRDEATSETPGIDKINKLRQHDPLSNRFESYENYDYLSIHIPDLGNPDSELRHIEAYIDSKNLTLIHDGISVSDKFKEELDTINVQVTPGDALIMFFDFLTRGDADILSDIEEDISALEDELINKIPDDCVKRIRALRRTLLKAKRYYEGLYNVLTDMEENVGGFLNKKDLRHLHIQVNRADRLSSGVINLRDFINQVSESYQNRLDISLNETMKFFTVITAVFAPLTLITGWYGMNLIMPEFGLEIAYPVVIAVSVLIAVICLFLFKKKKWF